jgi:hypothetical protein
VLVEPLLERLKNQEVDVEVLRVDKLDSGEHCDTFWHVDAVELCYGKLLGACPTCAVWSPDSQQRISKGRGTGIQRSRPTRRLYSGDCRGERKSI